MKAQEAVVSKNNLIYVVRLDHIERYNALDHAVFTLKAIFADMNEAEEYVEAHNDHRTFIASYQLGRISFNRSTLAIIETDQDDNIVNMYLDLKHGEWVNTDPSQVDPFHDDTHKFEFWNLSGVMEGLSGGCI